MRAVLTSGECHLLLELFYEILARAISYLSKYADIHL